MQDFEDVIESQPEEGGERDPKRQKNDEEGASSPYNQMFPSERGIVASTKTRMAMEQRERDLRAQDEEDVRINQMKQGKSLSAQLETVATGGKAHENTGENMTEEEAEKLKEDMVRLSDDEMEEYFDTSQSDRKSTRLNSSHSGESRMPSSA